MGTGVHRKWVHIAGVPPLRFQPLPGLGAEEEDVSVGELGRARPHGEKKQLQESSDDGGAGWNKSPEGRSGDSTVRCLPEWRAGVSGRCTEEEQGRVWREVAGVHSAPVTLKERFLPNPRQRQVRWKA